MEHNTAHANPEGIVYKLPQEFLAEFNDKFLRTVPAEKVAQEIEEDKIGKLLIEEGAHKVDGLGQMMGKIPVREFYRWHQSHPGCWQDDGFVREFFRDNPKLRAQGYEGHKVAGGTRKGGRWNS